MEDARIKEIRYRLSLSQERFAQLLSVSAQTVRRWESGLTKPLPSITLRLEELDRETRQSPGSGGGTVNDEEKGRRAPVDVDVGLGLGGLFKGVEGLLDLARMAQQGKKAGGGVEEGALGGGTKAVYGFSVRLGTDGGPVIERFGNVQETASGTVATETREPLVDVFREQDHLLVVVELPGVSEEDIDLSLKGDILEVVASTGARKYQKEVLLPAPGDPASLRSSFRNGVLEVRLAKA